MTLITAYLIGIAVVSIPIIYLEYDCNNRKLTIRCILNSLLGPMCVIGYGLWGSMLILGFFPNASTYDMALFVVAIVIHQVAGAIYMKSNNMM